MKKDYRELYEKITKSDWFKKAYQDKSLGECPIVVEELEESEDEKIRKELVEQVGYIIPDKEEYDDEGRVLPTYHKRIERYRAYLEKQKNQKPTAEEVLIKAGLKPFKEGDQWCILAGDNIQEGICGFGDTIDDALYDFLMAVLDMVQEQKPDELDELEKLRKQTHEIQSTFKKGIEVGRKEQEWSEEDEQTIGEILSFFRKMAYGETVVTETGDATRWHDWLVDKWGKLEEHLKGCIIK